MKPARAPLFISFEGIEGSGKSTALSSLCAAFADQGLSLARTREPGATDLGLSLRALLLAPEARVNPEAELFLYLADRAQHVAEVIRPALEEGRTVLCDRYADSTIVYQGHGRGLDVEKLHTMNAMAVGGLWPDLTLLFDLPVEVGLARARQRNAEQDLARTEGRFEAEAMAFHQRVRQGYLSWAGRFPERFRIIDAAASPKLVAGQAMDIIRKFQKKEFQS